MTAEACTLRQVTPLDQPILWEILYEALWDPPGSNRRPRSVLQNPQIAAYVENWGSRSTDLGFLAVSPGGTVAGGILSRLMLPPFPGGAFYDDQTPQLGIAVFPAFRRQGIGASLFTKFLAAAPAQFPGVALGVHPENDDALRLYRKFGFVQFAVGRGGYLNMVKRFGSHGEPDTTKQSGTGTPRTPRCEAEPGRASPGGAVPQ